jgi:hypothetical protein
MRKIKPHSPVLVTLVIVGPHPSLSVRRVACRVASLTHAAERIATMKHRRQYKHDITWVGTK